MARVFISHSSRDQTQAAQINEWLVANAREKIGDALREQNSYAEARWCEQ